MKSFTRHSSFVIILLLIAFFFRTYELAGLGLGLEPAMRLQPDAMRPDLGQHAVYGAARDATTRFAVGVDLDGQPIAGRSLIPCRPPVAGRGRFQPGREAEHAIRAQHGFVQVGDGQQGGEARRA